MDLWEWIDETEKRVKSLESERFDAGNELRETESHLLNNIESRRMETQDLKKRVEELEKLAHEPVTTEDVLRRWTAIYGATRSYSNPEPHTCGECKHPWRKEGHGMICYRISKGKKDSRCMWVGPDTLICSKFEPRGE